MAIKSYPRQKVGNTFMRTFDWSDWLQSGDTLATCSVSILPNDLTLVGIAEIDSTKKLVNFLVTGGTAGTNYAISCSISSTISQEVETDTFYQYMVAGPI